MSTPSTTPSQPPKTPAAKAAAPTSTAAGAAAALRYRVNPAWRGVTPYVALLRPGQPVTFVMGPPSAQEVKDWAAPSAR